jgi:hypothetical protein
MLVIGDPICVSVATEIRDLMVPPEDGSPGDSWEARIGTTFLWLEDSGSPLPETRSHGHRHAIQAIPSTRHQLRPGHEPNKTLSRQTGKSNLSRTVNTQGSCKVGPLSHLGRFEGCEMPSANQVNDMLVIAKEAEHDGGPLESYGHPRHSGIQAVTGADIIVGHITVRGQDRRD